MLGERSLRIALGVWLVCCAVLWNVLFDGFLQAAEERYVKMAPALSRQTPAAGAKAAMEPAIRQAALRSTEWTGLALAAGAATLLVLARRRRVTSSSSPSSASPSAR